MVRRAIAQQLSGGKLFASVDQRGDGASSMDPGKWWNVSSPTCGLIEFNSFDQGGDLKKRDVLRFVCFDKQRSARPQANTHC